MKFELKPHNRNVPDNELIADLKHVATEINKAGVTIEEYNKQRRFHNTTLIRRFGSWFKALEKAVLGKTRNFYADVPNEELIADLKRVAGEIGKSSVTIDEYNERGRFRNGTLFDRFGSWFNALELAGLKKTRNLNISNEELFINVADVWTKLGRQPSYDDLTSKTSKFSKKTYEKRFTTWRKALEAFVVWANEGEAQAIEAPPQQFETKSFKPSPKKEVVRHRTSRTINYRLQFLVMRRDNFKCKISGRSPATDPSMILEVDHIVPWDKGGETVIENLQTLAKEINIGKSNLDMYQTD